MKTQKTVIIPAKNEEGNIEPLFKELDKLNIDEVIFSIGHSEDKTSEKIQECSNRYKNLNVVAIIKLRTVKQMQYGKVWN